MVFVVVSTSITEPAEVNPKKLYWSVMFSFGTAFTTNAFIINSNEVRHDK